MMAGPAGFNRIRVVVAVILAEMLSILQLAAGQIPSRHDGIEMLQIDADAAEVITGIGDRPEGVDLYDDRLPAGAVLRLGTVRFRQGAEGPERSSISLSYSSDGKVLATTDGDAIVLWNAGTGERLRRLRSTGAPVAGRSGQFGEVAFAPQIDELTARRNDGRVVVWDLKSNKETWMADDDDAPLNRADSQLEYRGLAYSPSGTMLAVNWGRKTIVYDRTTGQILQQLGAEGDPAQFGLAWSRGGEYVARGSHGTPARLWNISDGEGYVIRNFKVDVEAFAISLAISHDGKMLAAGCIGNGRGEIMICLWFMPTGGLRARLPSSDAVSIHFTPDDKTLVSATENGSIDIWDVGTGVRRQTITAGLGIIRRAALTPDGKTVAIGAVSSEIGQWDIETGQKKLAELVGHSREISSVVYAPDGKLIATLADNGEVRLWDAATGKQRRQMKSSYSGHLAFDPTGKQLATGGQGSGAVDLWDVHSGERTRVLTQGEKTVRQVGFSPNGSYLVTVGSNSQASWSSRPITDQVHVWDAMTGQHIRQFELAAPSTESMLLLPGDRSVVLGAAYSAESKGMQVLDLETGAQTGVAIGHASSVNSLAYGNGLVASGSRDKTVRLWDPATWKEVAVLQGHEDTVQSVAFSPDGKWLASCDLAGSVRVWNVETCKQVHEFPGQGYGTMSVCFSPKGDRIVTALKNATALVWDARFATP